MKCNKIIVKSYKSTCLSKPSHTNNNANNKVQIEQLPARKKICYTVYVL